MEALLGALGAAEAREAVVGVGEDGYSPLHAAAAFDASGGTEQGVEEERASGVVGSAEAKVECVKLLLEAGAPVDAKTGAGMCVGGGPLRRQRPGITTAIHPPGPLPRLPPDSRPFLQAPPLCT